MNSDWTDLLGALNAASVRYLVVGAHAVSHYVEPRFTKDLDLWVEPSAENAERVWRVLRAFGAPLNSVSKSDFADASLVYHMGIEPNRVDFLMGVDGLSFQSAWRNRVPALLGTVPANLLSRNDLVRSKRAAGRPQDLLDLQRLLRTTRASTKRGKGPSPKRRRRQ